MYLVAFTEVVEEHQCPNPGNKWIPITELRDIIDENPHRDLSCMGN